MLKVLIADIENIFGEIPNDIKQRFNLEFKNEIFN